MQNGSGRSTAAHVPLAVVQPKVRCYFTPGKDRYAICGDDAHWRRPGNHWFDDAFFCDAHRDELDVPLVGECVVRRVSITADIVVTGASMGDPFARAEALRRLGAAIAAAGGVLELSWIQSTVVRYDGLQVAAGRIEPPGAEK